MLKCPLLRGIGFKASIFSGFFLVKEVSKTFWDKTGQDCRIIPDTMLGEKFPFAQA